jgi:hypothetical protein
MAKLDFQKARQFGFSEQQIRDFADKNNIDLYNDPGQGGLLDLLPLGGSILGMIGGGVLGSSAGPVGTYLGGAGGNIAGTAAGRGLEDAILKLLGKSPKDIGKDVLSTTASYAPYGFLPGAGIGGDIAENVLGKGLAQRVGGNLLTRLATGLTAGGASRALSDIASGQDVTKDIPNIKKQAISSAVMNEIIPGLFDVLGAGKNYAGRVVSDIAKQRAAQTGELSQTVAQQSADELIPYYHQPLAIREGIIPGKIDEFGRPQAAGEFSPQYVDMAIKNRDAAAQRTEDALQKILKQTPAKGINDEPIQTAFKDYIKVDPEEAKMLLRRSKNPQLAENPAAVNKVMDTIKEQKLSLILNDFKRKASDYLQGDDLKQFNDFLDGKTDGTLMDVNTLKRIIGRSFSHKDKYASANILYSKLRQYIEEASGKSKDVMDLNEKAHLLTELQGYLEDAKGKMGLSKKFTTLSQQQALEKAKSMSNLPVSLELPIALLSALGGAVGGGAIGAATKSFGAGAGGTFGTTWALRSALKNILSRPEVQDAMSAQLQNISQETGANKIPFMNLSDLLTALGVRGTVLGINR